MDTIYILDDILFNIGIYLSKTYYKNLKKVIAPDNIMERLERYAINTLKSELHKAIDDMKRNGEWINSTYGGRESIRIYSNKINKKLVYNIVDIITNIELENFIQRNNDIDYTLERNGNKIIIDIYNLDDMGISSLKISGKPVDIFI